MELCLRWRVDARYAGGWEKSSVLGYEAELRVYFSRKSSVLGSEAELRVYFSRTSSVFGALKQS